MKNRELKEKFRLFFESKYWIFVTAALLLMAHTTIFVGGKPLLGGYQDVIFGSLLVLLLSAACLICEDFRFFIMPLISFVFIVPVEHSPNVPAYSKFYIEPIPLTVELIMFSILIGCLIFFLIRNRYRAKSVPWKNPIFLSMTVFCAALFLNGAFSSYYSIEDTVFPITFVLSLLMVYVLAVSYIRFDSTSFDYFMTCVMATGLLICAELLLAYLMGGVQIADGKVVKETVVLGWGVWTAIGGMLAFLMPACFYFAHSHRHGWIYYCLGFLEYGCIFLSQSRGALLFGTLVLILCLVTLCIKGENRFQNRILTACVVALGAVGFVILSDKILAVLKNYLEYGFADNGRFDKWKIAWKNFLDYPIFGAGFYNCFEYPDWHKDVYPYLYHCTPLQILASGGIIGFAAYLWHRVETVRLVFKKPNHRKSYLAFGIFGLLAGSLLDVLFFNTYPTIIYSLMLLFMEKTDSEPSQTLPSAPN